MQFVFQCSALLVLIASFNFAISYNRQTGGEYDTTTEINWQDNFTTTYNIDDEESGRTTVTEEPEEKKHGGTQNEKTDLCPSPPALEHGKIVNPVPAIFSPGTVVTYECEFGYFVKGVQRSIECLRTSEHLSPSWTNFSMKCTPRSCGDPGFVTNAKRVGSVFTFPNSVSFVCEDGFQLRGPDKRYCLSSGVWSGNLPTCERVFCKMPSAVENGRIIYTSLEFGAEIKYECDKGYLLKIQEPRYCAADGKWSGKKPRCQEAICDTPMPPLNGSVEIVGGEPRIGSIALFKCDKNKRLIGSVKSKCLGTGEWTFPTPLCVDPCIIPRVENGKIGSYKVSGYRKVFTTVPEKTNIENVDNLILTCEANYEPLGRPNIEESVKCSNGQWKKIPRCMPASCRGHPPVTLNAQLGHVDSYHGGSVTYHCKTHFTKTKFGNITCDYGTWKGIRPVCTDTRCDRDSIPFPGLLSGRKRYYSHGESFTPSCDKGYESSSPGGKLTCNKTQWIGRFPPCSAASCQLDLPLVEHGYPKEQNHLHSAVVRYACDDSYHMVAESTIRCSFGEWTGNLPVCKSDKCSFISLHQKEGVVPKNPELTDNGQELEFNCEDGYIANGLIPLCLRGQWGRNEKSPCSQRNCEVPELGKGFLATKLIKHRSWPLHKQTYVVNEKEKIGASKPPNYQAHTFCDSRYTFQGKGQNEVKVECIKGKWTPRPLCLPTGTIYEEEIKLATTTEATDLHSTLQVNASEHTHHVHIPTEQTLIEVTPSHNEFPARVPVEEDCFCNYLSPYASLIAYTGKELLQNGNKVKRGCKVMFRCKEFGYERLHGTSELECVDCRPWHSSAYPTCLRPSVGDAVLEFPEGTEILPGGGIAVKSGSSFEVACYALSAEYYPIWVFAPRENTVVFNDVYTASDGSYFYVSFLRIKEFKLLHKGNYTCTSAGHQSNLFQVEVKDTWNRCLPFREKDSLVVTYEKEDKRADSRALFSCKNQNYKLRGSQVITCLENGQWSGPAPRCVAVCSELIAPEGLVISYTVDSEENSVASFHCLSPRVRSGDSNARCLPNGKWSNPLLPTCSLPQCRLDSVFKGLSNDVKPVMDNIHSEWIPYGSFVPLTCEDNLKLVGSSSAKCLGGEQWEVGKVQCISGCPRIEKPADSDLIVHPESESYRFGEFASLSCPPGKKLSSEVVRLMCLTDGWSEKELPSCHTLQE